MNISKEKYSSPLGEITIFTLRNDSGAYVSLSTLGAGIVALGVPDRYGNIENVALAYADPTDYLNDGPCLGKIPGRYANRIAKGKFSIDGRQYQLAVNNGPNALHGGPTGFQNRLWKAEEIPSGVRFTYVSANGEENYPGELTAIAEYTWSNDNTLELKLSATCDAATIINLTNHTYWNLDGADAGSIVDHEMRIKAENYIPTDDTLIPLGNFEPVGNTPMDFRTFKRLGKDLNADFPALKYGKGYDAGWLLDNPAPGSILFNAVILRSPKTGRTLAIDSDQPDAHVYTGNWLAGSPLNRSGHSYADYEGVAIELQGIPDSPNRPDFPDQTLRPHQTYHRTIRFRFLPPL